MPEVPRRPLTPAEGRLLELLRSGSPDAELAARLGLPVSDLRTRIDRMAEELGFDGREKLLAWRGSVMDSAAPNEGVREPMAEGRGRKRPSVSETDKPVPSRALSRRALLGLAAGGVAAVLGGTLWATRGRGGSTSGDAFGGGAPETPQSFATATPRPTFSAASLITWTDWDGEVSATEYPSGAPIPAAEGYFRLTPDNGSIEHRVIPSVLGQGARYRLGSSGAMVIDDAGFDGHSGYIFQNGPARMGSFRMDDLQVVDFNGSFVLFREHDGRAPSRPTGRYELVATEDGLLGRSLAYELPPGASLRDVHFGADGTVRAYFERPDESPGVVSISLESGAVAVTDLRTVVPNQSPEIVGWVDRDDGSTLLMARTDSFDIDFAPETALVLRTVRAVVIDGGSEPYVEWALDVRDVEFSPDGRLVIWEELQHEVFPDDVRYSERWPSLVVADALTLNPLFRVRSATLAYGDGYRGGHWLADSSGVVAAVRSERAGAGYPLDQLGFAVIAADGSGIERLPFAPVQDDVWFRGRGRYAPAPSPEHPELLAYGRLSLYNRTSGEWLHANVTSDLGPRRASPWAGGGEAMVFTLGQEADVGFVAQVMLAPRIEAPPFDDALRFRIAGDECLDQRRGPSSHSDIVDCLAPGEVVNLAPPNVRVYEPDFAAVYGEGGTVVRVAPEAGEEGWVALDYLEWA